MNPTTVMIGLDGATWDVLEPLMANGTMPFLRSFCAESSRAPLRSIVPALTPPAWTSMLTGRNPGQHGIFNFFGRDRADGHHIRLLTTQDISAEPVWEYANRHGLRATILNFPVTFPAPAVDGYVVAGGWMPWRQLRLGCSPARLFDRLKAIPGFNPRDIAMDMAHEEKALEGCRQDEYADWIDLHIRREQQWATVFETLVAEDPTDLVAILFDGVDKLQHLCWPFLSPSYDAMEASPWETSVREGCLRYFRQLDGLLEQMCAQCGPDATIVLTSDHGFGPQVRTFFVNAWLAQNGYLAWADGTGPQPQPSGVLGLGQVARHTFLLDWTRTRAYASMPGGNGIHIVRDDSMTDGDYNALCEQLIAELEAFTDPADGVPVVAAAWHRTEIFDGPALALAPDITLELADGGLFSILASDQIVAPRTPPTGTHAPQGILAVRGPGIRAGAVLPERSLLDVTPLLVHSLGLPIPATYEGDLPLDIFEDASRTAPVYAMADEPLLELAVGGEPVWQPSARIAQEDALSEEEEQAIVERLRALGYVE